jgi:hypothetical protein
MRSNTRELIAQLESFEWCANCGHLITKRADWVAATKLDEAKKSALSDEWLTFRLMVSNRMHRDASQVDHDRFAAWNTVVGEVHQAVTPLVDRVTRSWIGRGEPSKKERISIAWDVQGMCMEAEFADLLAPIFFLPRIFECYREGHMPCGWVGAMTDENWAGASTAPLPEGKLLVF